MNKKIKICVIWIVALCVAYVRPVYANSSWRWLTDKQPWQLLPIAIVFTLLVEISMHKYILNVRGSKIYIAIIAANICSYILPYVIEGWEGYYWMGYTIPRALSSGPYYMIGMGFLFMTLLVEIPVVLGIMKKYVEDKKKMIAVTVISNIITTGFVFVIERIVCQGSW